MFDRNSLVTRLGWRLAIVLSMGALLQTAWLFAHFRGMESAEDGLLWELLDFFKDVAWTTPVIGIATFMVCAAGMRQHLGSLRQLSEQAARIAPADRHTLLSVDQAPSEVQPLVTSVNKSFERLVEAVQVQRRFTANAAHELRTPVAVFRAGLERLPTTDDVVVLRTETERMGRIVGQLLSLARLEGHNGSELQHLDAAGVVRRAAEPLTHLASAGHVSLAFDVECEPVTVIATEEALTEITRNLVENAIGHAPVGSEVSITLARNGTLYIVDHGPGIPQPHREHLFERFWRGPSTSRPGSGLGLAIVAEACQRIGATVQCLTTSGGGATFEVRLATATETNF
jgi:two-component system sensor histidine kinase TctE